MPSSAESVPQPTQHQAADGSELSTPTPLSLSEQPTSQPNSTTNSLSPASPLLGLYLAAGGALLTAGVALGITYGNRQAAQIERDNPAPPPTATARPPRPAPPITPAQRAAAFRATLGALGLGTVLCGGFGVALVWGVGRYWGVSDTREFAVRMDSVVAAQRVKWLGSMTSSLPSQVAGLRSSLAGTRVGGWIRDKGRVADSSDGELSPQESKEVEQAAAFLKELEADYQRTVADIDKRRKMRAEAAERDKASKT